MRMRRCAVLLIEPRETLSLSLDSLLQGGDGLACSNRLWALAAHLGIEQEISVAEIAVLVAVPCHRWVAWEDVIAVHSEPLVRGLLDKGLLLREGDDPHGFLARDERLRAVGWWTPAAIAHYCGKWDKVTASEGSRQAGFRSMSELVQTLGPPPPHLVERCDADQRLMLPRVAQTAFDSLLDRRTTCRNFDTRQSMPSCDLAQLLERTFAARASVSVRDDTVVLKRTSPSGGGLHPIDAYVLVRDVEGVAPGIYHYHPLAHALEPLRLVATDALRALALDALAGQDYYADAHVLLVLSARFPRHFWKYRNHSKAYRVIVLDAGHLSQTLYLAATEAGLGAFVTGAINETAIEALLQLDPMVEGVLAICGLGIRAKQRMTSEFDPLGRVWSLDGSPGLDNSS